VRTGTLESLLRDEGVWHTRRTGQSDRDAVVRARRVVRRRSPGAPPAGADGSTPDQLLCEAASPGVPSVRLASPC